MAGQTENYHIYYPTDYDEIADVPENDRQQALSIEEALALIDLRNIVGDLTQLETTIKTSVVEAINELKGKTDDIGDITQLETTIKNNLVNAINELKTNTYNKTEVDNKISSVYKYKGTVATYADLPSTSLTIGDVYNVESTGDNYAWTGTDWDKLGGDIDLSEYYTKTQTDNLLEGKADTEDIPDLTDYVKNTDYAGNDNNVAGLIKVYNAYGIKIDSNGSLQARELTNEQYNSATNFALLGKGTLENVITGKQLVNQETLEESQASQDEIIAKLKADHPPIEEEGTALTLNGTGDFDLALNPRGNITQETTTGKNLLDYITNLRTPWVGLTSIINSDGSITTTGIPTSDYVSIIYCDIDDILENGQTYILSQKDRQDNILFLQINARNKSTGVITYYSLYNNNQVSFTADTETYTYKMNLQTSTITNWGSSSRTITNYYMLEKNSTKTDFEKYTGGQASPNPSFESPVKVVDGEYEVEVENKNLYDKNITPENYYYNAGGQKVLAGSGTYINQEYNLTGGSITISFTQKVGNDSYIRICEYDGNTFIKRTLVNTNLVHSLDSNTNKVIFSIDKSETAYFENLQIHVTHAEQTQTIDTSPNPLYSENDLYFKAVNGDSFYDSLTSEQKASLESGSWYVHNEYVKDILSLNNMRLNDERDTYWNITAIGSLHYNSDGHLTNNNTRAYCNYFKFGGLDGENKIGVYTNNTYPMMLKSDFPTYEAAAQWLSQHNGEIYLLYPLAIPTNTKITNTTLINQLETFQNMLAYQDQTNISQTHNSAQADMIINAQTIMSLQNMQKEIEDIDVSSYQTKIDSTHKLSSDLVDDTNKTNKFVTSTEKTTWNEKQNATDNNLTTTNKTITGAINEANSIAKGANQALSYGNYSTMITAFNNLANNVYNVGQNVMIITLNVPDLWISGIESTSQTYTYTTDEAFTTELNTNGYVQVGYYKLSALETQKVDLTDYEQNTNKTTTISSSSTDIQYPSAKAVYDYIQSLDGDEVSY